jgi:hypothetical protein
MASQPDVRPRSLIIKYRTCRPALHLAQLRRQQFNRKSQIKNQKSLLCVSVVNTRSLGTIIPVNIGGKPSKTE